MILYYISVLPKRNMADDLMKEVSDFFRDGEKDKKKEKDNSPQELLVQLNNSLRQEIQEIRKEVGENSEKSRQEIEKKLLDK